MPGSDSAYEQMWLSYRNHRPHSLQPSQPDTSDYLGIFIDVFILRMAGKYSGTPPRESRCAP